MLCASSGAAHASRLFCYGLYCLLEARYRDLTPGNEPPRQQRDRPLRCSAVVELGQGHVMAGPR
jgi:hypothetical protein